MRRPMSDLDLTRYDYHLPAELIAQQPVTHRPDARLMVVQRQGGHIHHSHVRDLSEWLRPGDHLVLNDSRVIPARLVGYRKATGGRWQGLFLRADDQGIWELLCKTRGKLVAGERIMLQDREAEDSIELHMLACLEKGIWAARPDSGESIWGLLNRIGRVPLPHYIRHGKMVSADLQRYQTVFANEPGSVAAPTAGLHFTHDLLTRLSAMGVEHSFVTLHVGMGTFRPITAAQIDQHVMHREWARLNDQTAERLSVVRNGGHRVIAVGTTAVRVLESAAAASSAIQAWSGETDLYIRPRYSFRVVDALLTNFHLPKSTLLVLVRTFGGDALIRAAYEEAIRERYRFFSYGDAMLIL